MNSATMRSPRRVVIRRPSTKTGAFGLFKRSGQRDAQIGVLRFARAIYHAPHNRDLHLFHAGVTLLPNGHLLAQIALDLLCHLLEEGARGASTAGAGSNLRREAADAHRLQNLLGDDHLFGAIAIGRRRERNANRIANTFLKTGCLAQRRTRRSLWRPCQPQ